MPLTVEDGPELLYLEVRWASLIPYGGVARLLEEVLPVAYTQNGMTIRNHLLKTAERIEADLGEEKSGFFDGSEQDWEALAHLHARETSLALVSRAPLANLEAYGRRMGWNVPWYSSAENDFNDDFGLTTDEGETFGLSVFLRDSENVFHTYFTTDRALEAIASNFTLLDWTVLGRQEQWENSPAGWPQSAPYVWWRRHDEYK